MDEVLRQLEIIENKIDGKVQENYPKILKILEEQKRKLEKEMKNLKETNQKLNYEIDKLTEKRKFVIYKSNKTYFVKHNEIYDRDDQKIGEFQ